MNWLIRFLKNSFFTQYRSGGTTGTLPSPRVPIKWTDVLWDGNSNTLSIKLLPNVIKNTVQNTNSMEALLDANHIVILSDNQVYKDALKLGSIVVWSSIPSNIIHSIVEVGEDEQGWYCYTQGVNIDSRDTVKVRKENIEWVALMVIWADTETFPLPPED